MGPALFPPLSQQQSLRRVASTGEELEKADVAGRDLESLLPTVVQAAV